MASKCAFIYPAPVALGGTVGMWLMSSPRVSVDLRAPHVLWGGRFSVSSMLLGRHLRAGGWEKVEHRLVWWGWANGGDVAHRHATCWLQKAAQLSIRVAGALCGASRWADMGGPMGGGRVGLSEDGAAGGWLCGELTKGWVGVACARMGGVERDGNRERKE